jgi:hypothetical protein
MKIKDLPEDSDVKISDLKVKLPENILEFANQFSSKIPEEVWLVGPMMGDWFVKINRDDTRVYPLFRDNIPFSELSEWEVVEIFGIKI